MAETGRVRIRKELLGAVGVVAAIAVGATLPLALSAAAPRSSAKSGGPPVATCSPPSVSGTPVASASPPCEPTLWSTPDTGLADGQSITVSGAGFVPDAAIGIVECGPGATGPSDCDLSTEAVVTADDTGSFVTGYTVSRIITITGSTGVQTEVDCAQAGCLLGAADLSTLSMRAATALLFNPKLPLLLSATVAPTGTVNPKTGSATISGTITCAVPVSGQDQVELTQIFHHFVTRGYGYASFTCTRRSRWRMTVPPGLLAFGVGPATVQLDLYAFAPGEIHRQVTATVKLELASATR